VLIKSAIQVAGGMQAKGEKAAPSVRVREALFNDHEQISSLESRYALETRSYEEWSHLWTNNPLYRILEKDWPIGWVLENEDKRVVGYLGNIPLWYVLNGQQIVAAGTHAWVADLPYRSYSILLLDRYFHQKTAQLYLSTTVNSQAYKAYTAFNSPPVQAGAWDRSAFWITHSRGFALSLLSMKELPFAKALSYPLSVAVMLKLLCARPPFRQHQSGTKGAEVEVRLCAGFDGRFDVFWEALRKKNPHLLLAVRTRELLEWHFKYGLLANRTWILTVSNRAGLAAYSIFSRQDNPRFGLKRVRLIDFQSLDGNISYFLPMILVALKRCRDEKIHMLESIGYSAEQDDVLERLAPLRRKLPCWMYYYKAANQALAETLANRNAWNPSCFDGDSSL
jgi:hypothetical protein